MKASATSEPVVRPTFLYIGAAKSGSSWIFEALREHPQVFVPLAKDLRFFEDAFYHAEHLSRYLRHFKDGHGFRAVGELSHNYLLSAQVAARIRQHLPDVKLLICLREPGNWLVSSYRYVTLFNRDAAQDFSYFQQQLFTRRNDQPTSGKLLHVENLQAYYAHFPPEQIKVMFFEDLRRDPAAFAHELYAFLGVNATYAPTVLHQQVNAARGSRFGRRFTQMLNVQAQVMRRLGLESALGAIKRSSLVNRLLFSGQPAQIDIPTSTLHDIRARCAATYPQLETLIGRPLPPEWYTALQSATP